jgi:hypothetical protein
MCQAHFGAELKVCRPPPVRYAPRELNHARPTIQS